MAVLMMGLAFTACSSDDDNNSDNNVSEKEQAMQAITSQYVNNVIFPIYQSLASQTSTLFDQLVEAKSKFRTGTLTQGDIDKLCNTFIAARSAWEQSESFLYGAATDFGIDPHIDTWPLDRTALAKALSSAEIIEDLDDLDDGGIDNAFSAMARTVVWQPCKVSRMMRRSKVVTLRANRNWFSLQLWLVTCATSVSSWKSAGSATRLPRLIKSVSRSVSSQRPLPVANPHMVRTCSMPPRPVARCLLGAA